MLLGAAPHSFADWFSRFTITTMSSSHQEERAAAPPTRVAASIAEPTGRSVAGCNADATPNGATDRALLMFAAGRAPSDVAQFLLAHPPTARGDVAVGVHVLTDDANARALGMLWALESLPALHGKWA